MIESLLEKEIQEEAIEEAKLEMEREKAEEELHKKVRDKKKEKTPKTTKENIDYIRSLKAHHIPISRISISVGMSEEQVEQVIASLPDRIDPKVELYSQLDAYDSEILNIKSELVNKEEKKDDDKSRFSYELSLRKQMADLLDKKTELLKTILEYEKESSYDQDKYTSREIAVWKTIDDNPPKISAEDIAKIMNITVSRVRHLLKGKDGMSGLLNKCPYIKEEIEYPKNGGRKFYYSSDRKPAT